MDAWAEELVSMMTSSGPLLLRSCVKKEEDLVLQAGSPSNSSLYSPTTTGLHFELELSQGDVVGSGAGLGSYGPQSPTLSRSLSRSLSSPEPDMEREAAERQYCSSTTAALGSAFRHAKQVDLSQDVGSGTGLTRSYDATSPALSRSLSRSLSSPEPDADRDGDRQYCSSTTASAVRDYHHNHRSHADGSKGDDDSPKRLCLVCGDVASGFHYGVASCEACKAFFKRTIQGNIEYTCPASNDCEINKRRRKACQACRFQKCIRMGMLKEGVRLDRVRGGRQKYRRTAPYPVEITTKKYLTIEDNVMVSTLSSCEPDLVFNVADGAWAEELATAEADTGLRVIAMLSDLYDRELVATIGWAKQIPGFSDLSLNDQMRLLQSAWPEVLSLSLAYRSMASPGKLNFASDFSLDERQAKECGLEEFYALCIQVVDRFSRLNINKEEYFIMKALVLANADVRVENFAALKKLRDNLMTALAEIVNILRPNMSVTNLQSILLCLPCIRQVDMCIRRFWTSVRRESRVHMNKLFVEMLDAHLR